MPTHDELAQFLREYAALPLDAQEQFGKAVKKMVNDLRAGVGFRPSLRVKGVQGHPGVFEMTWSGDGRATFHYGTEQRSGEAHIVWRRIGGHDILKNP
jgi:hypothetical protein